MKHYIPRLNSDLNAAIVKAQILMDAAIDSKQWSKAYAARQEHKALTDARDDRLLLATRAAMNPLVKRTP